MTEPTDNQMTEPKAELPAEKPGDKPAKASAEQAAEKTAVTQAPAPPTPPALPAPPSRFQLFLRRALRWAAGLGVVFALGVLATYYGAVRPRLDAAAAELETVRGQLTTTETELSAANAKITELKDEVDRLMPVEEQLIAVVQGGYLFEALAGVNAARAALALVGPAEARAHLEAVTAVLDDLANAARNGPPIDLDDIRQRLDLAASELESDPETAQEDLRLLIGMLEKTLAGLQP